jgi:hypothetical protein
LVYGDAASFAGKRCTEKCRKSLAGSEAAISIGWPTCLRQLWLYAVPRPGCHKFALVAFTGEAG